MIAVQGSPCAPTPLVLILNLLNTGDKRLTNTRFSHYHCNTETLNTDSDKWHLNLQF